jgi:hypothetical protein
LSCKRLRVKKLFDPKSITINHGAVSADGQTDFTRDSDQPLRIITLHRLISVELEINWVISLNSRYLNTIAHCSSAYNRDTMQMRRKYNPFLEQLGDNASLELGLSVLNRNKVALVNALKHNSTLKSLTVFPDRYISMDISISSAIADALKNTSSLVSLDLEGNSIRNEGAKAIADALKVNFSLTSLNLTNRLIQRERAVAIAVALKANSTLT